MKKITTISVSISGAGKLFGIHPHTIRQAIRTQEIKYTVVKGRYQLELPILIQWSQKNAWRKRKLEKYGLGQYVEKWKIGSLNNNVAPQKTAGEQDELRDKK